MQAVVKTPHTKVLISGVISKMVLETLAKEYKENLKIIDNDGNEFVIVTETKWFKDMDKALTPSKVLRIYRKNAGLTQDELGQKLKMSGQNVSDMENNRRNISIKTAKKLSKIFNKPASHFLTLI